MPRLPSFEYIVPKNLDDAVSILGLRGADAMVVADGTDLFPNVKRSQYEPKYLVGLGALRELRGVRDGNEIAIGAGVMLTQLSNDPPKFILRFQPPPLWFARPSFAARKQLTATCASIRAAITTIRHISGGSRSVFCMKKDGTIYRVAPGGKRCWAISSTDRAPMAVAPDTLVRLAS